MKAELDALLPPLHRPVEGRVGLPAVLSAGGHAKAEALAKVGERRILFRRRFMKRRLPRVGFRTS
jgi:hypothetical protein